MTSIARKKQVEDWQAGGCAAAGAYGEPTDPRQYA